MCPTCDRARIPGRCLRAAQLAEQDHRRNVAGIGGTRKNAQKRRPCLRIFLCPGSGRGEPRTTELRLQSRTLKKREKPLTLMATESMTSSSLSARWLHGLQEARRDDLAELGRSGIGGCPFTFASLAGDEV